MTRSHIQTILLSLLLVSCASAPANAQTGEPIFLVTVKNQDDRVAIRYEGGAARIDVYSPTGIGSAAFELESGSMPREIILRLHLLGLEEFRLTSAQDRIAASVSSAEVSDIDQRVLTSGAEAPLLPGQPLWMDIQIVLENAEKRIPLEKGFFEITVPERFIRQAGKSFAIEWIDFYR